MNFFLKNIYNKVILLKNLKCALNQYNAQITICKKKMRFTILRHNNMVLKGIHIILRY